MKYIFKEKHLYMLIFIIMIMIIFIVLLYCFFFMNIKRKEGFSNNTIILLGDSILNNSNYVKENESVSSILKKSHNNIINLAEDNATINSVYSQLNKIDINYNTSNTFLFLSIGGNDLLQNNDINKIFKKYTELIDSIHSKLPNINIIILNLYYPSINVYNLLIDKWNNLIKNFVSNNDYKFHLKLLTLNLLLVNKNDFTDNIEPSSQGSIKIANEILLLSFTK